MSNIPNDLSKYNFSLEGGRAVWYYMHYLLVNTYAIFNKDWPSLWPNHEILCAGDFKNHNVKWYFVILDTKVFTDFLDEVIQDSAFLQKIEDFIDKQKNNGLAELKNIDVSAISNADLNRKLKHYFDHMQYLLIVAGNIRRADRAILSVIKNKHGDRADEILRMSSILTRPSFALQEELALLELACNAKSGSISKSDLNTELKKIHDSFAWSVLGYYDEKAKTISDYSAKLDEFLKGDPEKAFADLKMRINKDQGERTEYLKTLDADDKVLANIASQSAYLKDYFKSSINELEYFAESLFDELEKRTGHKKNYIKDLGPNEILGLLDRKTVDRSIFNERLRHNVIFYSFGKIDCIDGKGADEFEVKYLTVKNSDLKEFKGRIACKGSAKGKVSIVKGPQDFHKLKDSEILVVMNTSPDYVPILRRAAAIVAEEGGLTAHVSVISREFGIPCVVGIHHITQNLKDGDLVEVDADKGIVKILK